MGKQVDKKTDSTLFSVSFNKSEKEQWLYDVIMETNLDTKFVPGGSKLIKRALEKYLSDLGFIVPDNNKIIKPKETNNSSKIPENKIEVIEEPKNIQQETKEETGIIDEELNVLGEIL